MFKLFGKIKDAVVGFFKSVVEFVFGKKEDKSEKAERTLEDVFKESVTGNPIKESDVALFQVDTLETAKKIVSMFVSITAPKDGEGCVCLTEPLFAENKTVDGCLRIIFLAVILKYHDELIKDEKTKLITTYVMRRYKGEE
ncbi:hypothetical protein SM033_00276 [Vibrio phage vB_VpaM_sm033]|nr:hypothetical protein SM033_00276 [Vibrio phage vB_VpaM_sm033]